MPEDRQGTGKHPHKSTEEPYPHHEGQSGRSERRSESGSHSPERREARGSENKGKQESLKEREYRDESGEVHHHTKTYEEQHSGEGERKKDEAA